MVKKKKQGEEFSEKKGNSAFASAMADKSEVAPAPKETTLEKIPTPEEKDRAIELSADKLDIRKGGNIVVGTMNVVVRPLHGHLKKRHEKFYKESKFHLAADIIFVLAILGLATILFFLLSFHPKAQIDLQTTLADESALSGQGETFIIQYKNNGKVDIKDSSLSFIFPKNFVLQKVMPEDTWSDQANTFQIGDLPRGANGSVKITGVPLGEAGEKQTLTYSLNYSQDNQRDNTLGSFIFPLEGSTLKTTFEVPRQVYQNIDFGGKITLKNTGRADIEKEIDLLMDNPVVILKSVASDQASLQNGAIIINGLKAGAEAGIEYEAVTGAGEGEVPAVLSTYLNLDGKRSKQNEAVAGLKVAAMNFPVEIAADKEAINSGDKVNFRLNFTNRENSSVSNILFDIMPSDSGVGIKDLVLNNRRITYKLTGNSIVLSDAFKPGEKGKLDFGITISRQIAGVNQEGGIIADINYQAGDKNVSYKIFSPKIKFVSALTASVKGLYYSEQGDQLGVGPLPPVVDVPTSYWIFWEINNTGNELNNFTMTADLPYNVGWTGKKTVLAGDVRYGEASHKIVWTVDDIAATGGNYRAGFEVQLIPTTADIGKVPNLVTNIKYNATDTFANQSITGSLSDINADLKDDPTASGKGKVIELKIVK